MRNEVNKKHELLPVKNIIILIIVFSGFFFLYRSCTSGYDAYAVFVQVKAPAVFRARLSAADARIVDHGRRLKTDIILMDDELDKGDGPLKGNLRWYGCLGIDCEEGWEESFLSEK